MMRHIGRKKMSEGIIVVGFIELNYFKTCGLLQWKHLDLEVSWDSF